MSLDLCLKQLHVVHINVFHRIQYIYLVLLRHFPVLQIQVTRVQVETLKIVSFKGKGKR